METGPGVSLFQGSDSIQLNSSTQDLEEKEEQEDIKRRQKEIQDLLTNEFDDLEDDASSNDSNDYLNSTRDADCSNAAINSGLQAVIPAKDKMIAQLQNDFSIYDDAENDMMTNHRSDSEIGSGMTQISVPTSFDPYRQTGTPFANNRLNDGNSIVPETTYELTKPQISMYPCNHHPKIEECTFNENYPYNYKTPPNHYNTHANNSNNGFADVYENNEQSKIYELGGGDNAISDHMNHCYKTSPNGRPLDDEIAYKTTEYDSKEQLEVLYNVRIREIDRLTEELQQLKLEKKSQKSDFSKKLMLLQAEVDRTNISKNEAQHALVDAKAEIISLQTQIESLKERNAVLEKTNKNVTEELNVARGSVMDLQQKVDVLERVQTLQMNDKTHEKFLKQAQEKYAVEIKNMQTQIDVLTDKLNIKETSYAALEHKLVDVRRAHEALMVEKADSMNRLSQALEESQAQRHNLIATNSAQQVMQLQAQVKMLSHEKDELHKRVQELQNKFELAKSDVAQYDSLLTTTMEEESDSIRQMKLGEHYNKSRLKSGDDITKKLKSELQRCVAGQAVKRKEINRLENTLSQKEKELNSAFAKADACHQKAERYAKRVNELEQELKSVLMEHAMKAKTEIQKLSDHLNDVKKQCDLLRNEKINLEQRLEEALAVNQEKLKRMHEKTMHQQEKETINEYNKEYLEIHAKAIERVKQEAQMEIIQLSVQIEQTQKELDHVKKLYIGVCGTKEQLINEHKTEIKMLKSKYATMESQQKNVDKLENELQTQIKLCNKLTKECESFKSQIIELEKDLTQERRKKEDHTRKIHSEIERAKEEALKELRNAHPNKEISFLLPDHCSDHLEKINQLEEDCKRLEEKLETALQEQKKLFEYQTELDDAKLKIAQVEILQQSWKQKYENAVDERNDLLAKVSKLDLEISSLKRTTKLEDSDDVKLKITRFQAENEELKIRCDILLTERNTSKEKISELETELFSTKKKISDFESRLRKSGEISSKNVSEKDLIAQLSRLSNSKEGSVSESILEQRIQFGRDLRSKDEKISKLKEEIEKIKNERDQLLKLHNQTKQLEQHVKNQNHVSAELNLSPRNITDNMDFQKKEIMAKEMRKEMEQRVAKKLQGIEEQRMELEQKHKITVLEWQTKYNEKEQEVEILRKELMAAKIKISQISQVIQFMANKLENCDRELQERKLQIEKLEQKESDIEEEKNLMAQMIRQWVAEIKEFEAKNAGMNQKMQNLKTKEEQLCNEIKILKDKEKHVNEHVNLFKYKYQVARKMARNYKSYAKQKEEFLTGECKRIKEGYTKYITQIQQKYQAQEVQYIASVKELESQYTKKMAQMQLTQKVQK